MRGEYGFTWAELAAMTEYDLMRVVTERRRRHGGNAMSFAVARRVIEQARNIAGDKQEAT